MLVFLVLDFRQKKTFHERRLIFMAETARFELAVRRTHDALARRWFQPLTHVSK